MQALDPRTVALEGSNLIEASAGTGKTWTISWLYLRLVLIRGLTVDRILVVTYTDAATAELRDRIRRRLADALAFLEGRRSEDSYAVLQEELAESLADGIRRLHQALVSYDEAAVFTIHGFCKRVLGDNAFEACLPFESELVADEDKLLTELADAFWYRHFLQPTPACLALLQRLPPLTPDSLLADVRAFIGKPYLHETIPHVAAADFAARQAEFVQAWQACRACWQQSAADVETLLLSGCLQGQTYSKRHVPNWVQQLDTLFAGMLPLSEALPHEVLSRFTPFSLREKRKPGQSLPEHAFFALAERLLSAWEVLHGQEQQLLEQVRLQLLHYLRRQLPLRKQQLGLLTFDDLLLYLAQALQQHPGLALRLATRYQAALIDEFQDTDPIQYAIFSRIYETAPEQPVFFVGDPKQAIYGFRGADIHTYLRAAQAVRQRHTLDRNFRSHDRLLSALNHLFAQAADPFRSGNAITYTPVEAGQTQDDLALDVALPALRLWDWDSLEEGHTLPAVQDQVAEAVADDIARLLLAAQQGRARIGNRPLESRDIAVLVRDHSQAERVRQALLRRSITSVQKSRESIFRTREAEALCTVLRAIAEPGHEGAVRQALVTELFAYSASGLYALDEEPVLLEAELEAFQRWHQTWRGQGFMPMFQQWLVQCRVQARLLELADGERRLTNLLHLAELVHTESRLHGHGMHALIRWLQQQSRQARQDEHPLRLESDADLVQIVTIHKSKGLEYGVVYCPFLWYEREPRLPPAWFNWHDPQNGQSCLQAYALAAERERHQAHAAEQAESLRLLYVALTRAKYHCTLVLVSGAINKFSYYSALGWLLFGNLPEGPGILGKLLKSGEMQADERQQHMHRQLKYLVQASGGLISHEPLPIADEPVIYSGGERVGRVPSSLVAVRLPPVPRVGSFSGLISGSHDEKPDYDTLVWQVPARREALRTAFPRGTQAGSCLHKMLEGLDFTQPLVDQYPVLQEALQRHGMAEHWLQAAHTLLENTLRTSLAEGFRLQDLGNRQRLNELEFYFPVTKLRLSHLQAVLHRYLPPEWEDIHQVIDRLRFPVLTGYMKGYVDLVFEYEERYFIVDYKSNELGTGPADYDLPAILQAMAEHHYYLQYLIYCVALHRYLQQRLPGYDWDLHGGGVLYLFLRGLQPGEKTGIFFHKPESGLILALDRLMQ